MLGAPVGLTTKGEPLGAPHYPPMISFHNGIIAFDLFRIGWALLSIACGFTSAYVLWHVLVALKEKAIGREDVFPAIGTSILIGCSAWFAVVVWIHKVMI